MEKENLEGPYFAYLLTSYGGVPQVPCVVEGGKYLVGKEGVFMTSLPISTELEGSNILNFSSKYSSLPLEVVLDDEGNLVELIEVSKRRSNDKILVLIWVEGIPRGRTYDITSINLTPEDPVVIYHEKVTGNYEGEVYVLSLTEGDSFSVGLEKNIGRPDYKQVNKTYEVRVSEIQVLFT